MDVCKEYKVDYRVLPDFSAAFKVSFSKQSVPHQLTPPRITLQPMIPTPPPCPHGHLHTFPLLLRFVLRFVLACFIQYTLLS